MIVAVPVLKTQRGYVVSPHFGKAPFVAFVEVDGGTYKIIEVAENPAGQGRAGHGGGRVLIAKILSRNPSAVIAMEMGEGAFSELSSRGVKVFYLPPEKKIIGLEEALELFLAGSLEEAKAPRELF
ncbi:MAG: NifB/NifX family molybdenum-iron cluster-binding protein [Desulfurococcaceae archaeon]